MRIVAPPRVCPTCHAWPCTCRPDAYERRPMPQLHPVRESCACGGPDLVAATRLDVDVVAAVNRHQVEPVHMAWSLAMGFEPQLRDDEQAIATDLARELFGRGR